MGDCMSGLLISASYPIVVIVVGGDRSTHPKEGELRLSALHQTRETMAELEPATEGSLQISVRIRHPLCHRSPFDIMMKRSIFTVIIDEYVLKIVIAYNSNQRLLGQGAGGGARTRDKRVPADLSADSLSTVPPTPLIMMRRR
ncbi:hypothetical protein PoB_005712200 [Plakobranchus ocellatus]|uniref:Uncharacterized protein n=1 Tax=Plakobranchus ocellatus TaxID=259542 RepID=A0AAV4CH42_9GAST|nr:hypothetical protein PoB_005712200 [Plakobranchus ocellatus]